MLENQLSDLRLEYDRLMMEGEDTFAQYHREWRISDERRYQLKKLNAQVNQEGKLKQQLAKELQILRSSRDKEALDLKHNN